jgi:hypothetical protein
MLPINSVAQAAGCPKQAFFSVTADRPKRGVEVI